MSESYKQNASLLLAIGASIAMACATGCALVDPFHAMEPPGYSYSKLHPREPYRGTGTVVEVRITSHKWKEARADYSPHERPVDGEDMLFIRMNTVVGKAHAEHGDWLVVTEGTPAVGDLVVGLHQHEKEYETQSPAKNFTGQTR